MVVSFWLSNQEHPLGNTRYFVSVADNVGNDLLKNIRDIIWNISSDNWRNVLTEIEKEIKIFNGKFIEPLSFPKLKLKEIK